MFTDIKRYVKRCEIWSVESQISITKQFFYPDDLWDNFDIRIINNLSTSITSYVSRKGRRAGRNIQLCAFFTVALDGVKWLYSRDKRLCTDWTECWVGCRPGPDTKRKRDAPITDRNQIPVTRPVAYSIPTEIFWLLLHGEGIPKLHNFTIKHMRL